MFNNLWRVILAASFVASAWASQIPEHTSRATTATDVSPEVLARMPPALRNQFLPRHEPPRQLTKRPGLYSFDDWQNAIDSTWGPGVETSVKNSVYSSVWNSVDTRFPCFQDLDTNLWDSIWIADSTELADSVSQGRFHALLNYATMALRDFHTAALNIEVSTTIPAPGVPILLVGGWGVNHHFGAALIPLSDNTLVVNEAVASHPLGLVPGDRVLGYDGVLWEDLYPQLIAAELPIATKVTGSNWWGSHEESAAHSWLVAAGRNWHLFDTIDIVRHATGDTLHLPTSLLDGASMNLVSTDQLDILGVLKPDLVAGECITWGIVDSTKIGYIYAQCWADNDQVEENFRNAVDSLMHVHEATGIIFDFRTNFGNTPTRGHSGFELLFNEKVDKLKLAERTDGNDHFAMGPPTIPPWFSISFVIDADTSTFYDHPIAILTGPGCISAGEINAIQLSFHPMAKAFGKPTVGAFSGTQFQPIHPDFAFALTEVQVYIDDTSDQYLVHDQFPDTAMYPWVEFEDVWHTADDIAMGIDGVVEAAKAWILSRDLDQDGVVNENDNCPNVPNADQADSNSNGVGDACEPCLITLDGDINESGTITSADIIALVNYVFKGGLLPLPCEANGDVNCSGTVTSADIIKLVNFVFKGGEPPCDICNSGTSLVALCTL